MKLAQLSILAIFSRNTFFQCATVERLKMVLFSAAKC